LSSAETFLSEIHEAARTARTEPEFSRLFFNAFEKASIGHEKGKMDLDPGRRSSLSGDWH
jgi:hypothetical protein